MSVLGLLEDITSEDIRTEYREREKAAEVVFEYLSVCNDLGIPHRIVGHYVEDLLKNLTRNGIKRYSVEVLLFDYFKLKGTENGKLLEAIMKKHDFHYSNSIHNAIYYLLGKKSDLMDFTTDPMLWPGVNNISKNGNFYTLETELGRIELSKAAPKFLNTNSSYIFKKPLMGKCYSRTLEFVEKNKGSNAILSRQPNFFNGGHYHAYAEMKGEIIDLAANTFYDSKEFADKVLCGNVIAKLSFEEIQDTYKKLDCPEIRDREKLYILTAFYDMKNRISRI